MIETCGLTNRYIEIDLTARQWRVFTITRRDCMEYLGGRGIAVKLLYERFDKLEHADPLGRDNILCFAMGAFLGTKAPCSARFSGAAKSPLTGLITVSSCGGPFGEAFKTAGWDGMVVSGTAAAPTVLRIDELGVSFEDGRSLWGLDTRETAEQLALTPREAEMVIGPAGEHMVRYAGIRSGDRYLSRGGLGAVMGAKRLKAVVARGKSSVIRPVKPKLFSRALAKTSARCASSRETEAFRRYGTNAQTEAAGIGGLAPVYNFRDRVHPDLAGLTGKALARRYAPYCTSCRYCTVLCGISGEYPDGKRRRIPEYETNLLFGSNIGNFDPDAVGQWNEQMNRYGLDPVSAGGSIAWAMEANQRGIRNSELAFGQTGNISKVLEDIAYLRDEGEELARGTRWLSETYGGREFACQVKGMELPAYDPRAAWGQGLSFAVANRGGCHLSAPLAFLESATGLLPPCSAKSKARWVIYFEDLSAAAGSLQTCPLLLVPLLLERLPLRLMPRKLLGGLMHRAPSAAQGLLRTGVLSDCYTGITGYPVTDRMIHEAGRRIQVLERYMNVRLGVTEADDTLPDRFVLEGETMHKRKSTVPIDQMVREYYQLRGYDRQGKPEPSLLRELHIEEQ